MTWPPVPEKGYDHQYQKWDYITLDDFRNRSCANVFWYFWLWLLAIISVAVYAADTFTAVNLLAYNHFASEVQPTIKLSISKWIFAATILFSWVLCAYEWFRAIRVLRRGNVAENYLDPLAATLQSIRPGSGRGWRRFLVFSELTNSRKGADYVALFCYFQFKYAIRLVAAEGPRQVVNAVTLWAVMQANVIPVGQNAPKTGESNFDQFWSNLEILYQSNPQAGVIYSTMLFSLSIWVFGAICLILSGILYIAFLWHYIPSEDGTLSKYCRRKIDGRLAKIVSKKVQQAIEDQEKKRKKDLEKHAKKRDARPLPPGRSPTLPSLAGTENDSTFDQKSGLSRQTTQSTLAPPAYRQPSLPDLDDDSSSIHKQPTLPSLADDKYRQPMLYRSETQSSNTSFNTFGSNRPLLQGAASMAGYEDDRSFQEPPAFAMPRSESPYRPGFDRSMTNSSQGSNRPYPGMATRNGPPNRRYPPPSISSGQGSVRSMPYLPRSDSNFSSRPPVGRNLTGRSQDQDQNFNPPSRAQTAPMYSEDLNARPNGLARNFSLLNREQAPSSADQDPTEGPSYEMQPQLRNPSADTALPPQKLPTPGPTNPYRAYNPYRPPAQEQNAQEQDTQEQNAQEQNTQEQNAQEQGSEHQTPQEQSNDLEQNHSRDGSDSSQTRTLPRAMTNPIQDHFQRPDPPRRVGTAPLPLNSYSRNPSLGSREIPVIRPGTTGPSQASYPRGYDDNFL